MTEKKKESNIIITLGFIFSFISLNLLLFHLSVYVILKLFSIYNYFSVTHYILMFISSLAGLTLSIIGITKKQKDDSNIKNFPIVGIVLSSIIILFVIVSLIIVF